MRKLLLFASVLSATVALNAQQNYPLSFKDNHMQRFNNESIVRNTNPNPGRQHRSGSRSSRASILNSVRIGNAGNLLTIVNGNCNQLDVNDSLNTVIFVHRNDPTNSPGTNVAQYRYDVSKDRGLTWTTDIGPITDDPTIDNVSVNGRFPQALIFNPEGNTVADSAYLIYDGTWHNGSNGRWFGQMRGRGKLSGDLSTFNVNIDPSNAGNVAVASGFTQGAPGVFWNVNQDYTGTFSSNTALTGGVVVQKGVWNPTTKDVDYTEVLLPANFVTVDDGTNVQSEATSFNIAFDPTGQKGWIFCLGDITADNDSTLEPVYWSTVDGGDNWDGPNQVSLDDVAGVKARLLPDLINGDPASQNPTTAFDADLTVDSSGNPHLLVVIGSGDEYAIQAAEYDVWDITIDRNETNPGCVAKGIFLDHIRTLRGTFTSDNPASTEDNRPQVSRSNDGSKVFFFWLESDFDFVTTPDNDVPNLFGRGLDIATGKLTQRYNFTEGDSLWGGETVNTPGGVFGGAIYPAVSPTVLKNGNAYNIPVVFTQIDYDNDPSNGLGSDGNPAGFWYVNNININEADFTIDADNIAPTITLNSTDTISILVNTAFTDPGATAFDCVDGVVTVNVTGSVDNTQVGVYTITYTATDASGNTSTETRTVIVGNIPVADFDWTFPVYTYRAKFNDLSLNFPTSWTWSFGDGGGSTIQSPTRNYTANGTYNVCLTAANSYGQNQICKDVTIVGVGIEDVIFENSINMFPNPTNGKVSIRLADNINSDVTVSVYNTIGDMLVQPTVYKAGNNNIELNLSGAASGIYFVKVQSTQGVSVKSLTLNSK